jgi:hypothetical protein
MKIDFKNCTEEELWKYVALHLEKRGFDVVLVGGGVVSIYSQGAYKSGDLDFIVRSFNKKELPRVLAEIGFLKTPQRYYKHPECNHLFLEFPSGPIEIAQRTDVVPSELEVEGEKIKILSPTDCVLDRLEQFLYVEYGKPHGERKLLEQAKMVAEKQPVDWAKIKNYCEKERKLDVFDELSRTS